MAVRVNLHEQARSRKSGERKSCRLYPPEAEMADFGNRPEGFPAFHLISDVTVLSNTCSPSPRRLRSLRQQKSMKRATHLRPSADALRFLRSAVASQTAVAHAQSTHHQTQCLSSSVMQINARARKMQTSHCNARRFSTSSRSASELPSNPQTHYDFFPTTLPNGPPPTGSFSVDLKQLRNEFLKLQASAHPDRHPPERKAAAEALSARINEAYKTLQSPLSRAQYLLSLRGDHSSTNDAAKLGEAQDDQSLLMEVLELREQIEEAETEDQICEIKEENNVRIAESVKILEDAFRSDKMEEAAREAVRLRYWVNVDETCHAWEEGKPAPLLQH